ncbi:MAG: glycosyltransferase family 2 protein [Gammaproteobacteria bacterium]
MDLSVVIPAYNEAESIPLLVDEVCDCLDTVLDYELIVVDDCSSDATREVLQKSRKQHPRLRVLHHGSRSGQSAAICSGVQAARAPLIATLDGDGQNDPVDILNLYRAMERLQDELLMVAGYRRQRRDTWLKRISSRIANRVRAAILKDATPDTGCGLKVFSRATFLALPQFDHMHRFLPALVRRLGGTVLSVDVRHRPRERGKSKYGLHNRLWVGIVDLLGVWWLQRRGFRPDVTELG